MPADSPVLLQGAAFDDAGRRISGSRLKRYVRSRLIGRGEHLTVRRLSPGATVLKPKATDSQGRTSATQRIRVLHPNPILTAVRARDYVSPHGRHISITLGGVNARIAYHEMADAYAAGALEREKTLTEDAVGFPGDDMLPYLVDDAQTPADCGRLRGGRRFRW